MKRRHAAPGATTGDLDESDIDDRMSAIRDAIVAEEDDDILLLTEVLPDTVADGEPAPEVAAVAAAWEAEGDGSAAAEEAALAHAPATTIAGMLLDAGALSPEEVEQLLRSEFRHWLETDGRQVLLELLDELVERDSNPD